MIKKDLYLIICLLLAAALLFIGKETLMHDAGFVTATVDGAPYGSWPLDKNDTIRICTPYGQNEFTIKNGTVRMTAADCPHKDCLRQGMIHTADSAIICLPHHLVIEIQSAADKKIDGTVR